ncbi:MAG: hypothetical protein KF889_01640 [Alphaproteobacteria bacterium]|nr:hypothetical protein [Alphaproteobacteria bacterium]MCW5741610.1 hypothetical protein [Alphaproteobacteria bacterium]
MLRRQPLKRRAPLKAKSQSETALVKESIQALLRAIVIQRDGGCILRHIPDYLHGQPPCNGHTKAGELILQADHLITRANGATFADHRLVVCVCKGHHGWKSVGSNMRKAQYDAIVKQLIEPERVALWEAAERDSWKPTRYTKSDWLKEEAYLRIKLATMQQPPYPRLARAGGDETSGYKEGMSSDFC